MTTREQLIQKYEDMMYGFGEFDVFDDDIAPKLANMTVAEIRKQYNQDRKYYQARENAGGYWG